ncbi:MAG TPA: outer membrane lipoprotein carrier protein LolA, partial [Candidatus Binatia bacterium]|nr:outer membrane lipoprotein carrier protein LolA [Candidatus Binatia bacterium]
MNRRWLFCLLALIAASVAAAGPLEKIQSMLAKPQVLCGRFDQKKQLTGLKKPLSSSGRFCVVPDKGVLWRNLQPFPHTVRLTRDEIVQRHGDRTTTRLDARQEPAVRTITNVFFALLAGDFGQLEKFFEIHGGIHGNGWNAALKPREAGLANAIG